MARAARGEEPLRLQRTCAAGDNPLISFLCAKKSVQSSERSDQTEKGHAIRSSFACLAFAFAIDSTISIELDWSPSAL